MTTNMLEQFRLSIKTVTNRLQDSQKRHFILLGLEGSGVTTLINRLSDHNFETLTPILGFNVLLADKSLENVNLTCWHVGGCARLEPFWKHCFVPKPYCVLFVMDSTDSFTLGETLNEMNLFSNYVDGCILAVLANKQEMGNSLPLEEIERKIIEKCSGLMSKAVCWRLFPIGDEGRIGMERALEWINGPKTDTGNIDYAVSVPKITIAPPANETPKRPDDSVLLEKLAGTSDNPEDEDEFMNLLMRGQVIPFDHRAHLRVAFILLRRSLLNGTSYKSACLSTVHAYVDFFSFMTNKERYHLTMTQLWCHLVAHRIATATDVARISFQSFLKSNLDLMWGQLLRQFYSKDCIFSPKARSVFVPPDLSELPPFIWNGEEINQNIYFSIY